MNRLFWPTLLLSLLLTLTFIGSEVFQNPTINTWAIKHKNPFTLHFIEGVTRIQVINRVGEIILSRDEEEETKDWKVIRPRMIEASKQTLDKISTSLTQMNIRKVYEADDIHMNSFSLNGPVLTLTLTNPLQGSITLKIGVINPSDQSAYVLIGNRNVIYQIDNFKYPIESYTLSDFIDSRVITLGPKEIISFDLFGGGRLGKQKLMGLKQLSDNEWRTEKNGHLSETKVNNFLLRLTSFKGQMILDKRPTQSSEKIVLSYLNSPRYLLEIKSLEATVHHYEISAPIEETLPDLKISKSEQVILRSSDREHLIIAGKELLDLLETKEQELTEKERAKTI